MFLACVLNALLFSACGGGSLTLSEYSDQVATLLVRVDTRLDAHAARVAAAPPNVQSTQAFFDDRVVGYNELVDGVDELKPPDEVVELHAVFQEILADLLAAERARAAFAKTVSSVEDLNQVWEGSEAQAVRDAELRAIELCYAAQSQVDATEEREAFADVPWMPARLQEVVLVSFNCPE